eukprot:4316172-Pyramimonas_sp.AAC.1
MGHRLSSPGSVWTSSQRTGSTCTATVAQTSSCSGHGTGGGALPDHPPGGHLRWSGPWSSATCAATAAVHQILARSPAPPPADSSDVGTIEDQVDRRRPSDL